MNDPSEPHPMPVHWTSLSKVLSLAGLALLAWGVSSQVVRLDALADRPVGLVLLVVAGTSWIVGLVLRQDASPVSGAAIGVMAVAGGALTAFAPLAMVFPAVAVLSAAIRWRIQAAAAVAGAGWMVLVVVELARGPSLGVVLGCLAAILGGALIGIARREAAERVEQSARAEVEVARAEVERERAELLSDRNHMAREIHDVLAHTLAALSLQLEAFGTVVDADPATSPAVREQLDRTRRLVHEGLDEARRAVGVLRDDVAPLDDQLRKLAESHDVAFATSGRPERLPAQVVVGLVRATQEALTNVMKHATGAPTSLVLSYAPDRVSLVVENGSASGSPVLHDSGGGYGLHGIAERLALIGGRLDAGPTDGGWRVRADVPLPVPTRVSEGTAAR